jgi:ABC-type nitrate/sulfonate/bicarbonate transport system substrate-binding protein
VEFVQNNSNVTLLQALIAGEVDVVEITPDGALSAAAQGSGLKIIGGTIPGLPHVLFARKDIKSVKDLKGKRVGTSQIGALPQILVMAMLKKEGMDPQRDVQWVVAGNEAQRIQALLADKIDATANTIEFLPIVQANPNYHMVLKFRDMLPEYLRFALITTDKVISEKRDVLQNFMLAYSEGLRYAVTHPEETAKLAGKILNVSPDDPQIKTALDVLIGQRLVAPDLAVTGDQVNFMQDINIMLGKQPSRLPLERVLDLRFQQKVVAELGPWQWR